MTETPCDAIVLFGHGARDPRWAEPMRAIAARIAQHRPDLRVELAFLEFLSPTLPQAAVALAAGGARAAVVVPVFLAGAGHVLRDLPQLLEQARTAAPGLQLHAVEALGERPEVLDAMAAAALAAA